MKSLLLTSVILLYSFMANATTLHQQTAPKDPGVINKKEILFWMVKRGELAANASEAEKRLAIDSYLAGMSFKKKTLPGDFGKRAMLAQSLDFIREGKNKRDDKKLLRSIAKSSASATVVTEAKILAIMIDFHDHQADKTSYPASHYDELIFAPEVQANNIDSVYQYYQAESGGTLKLVGSANGWVRADNDAAYYGGNDPDNNDDDKNVPALVLEAVTKAVAELNINLNEYDTDNDGILDHVMIFHSSIGEEAGGGELAEDAIWSHRYYVFDEQGRPVSVPGSDVKLYGYTINPVNARVGVVAHEFGHDLGVPDEYDTDNGTFSSPVGDWSIMASGSWVDGGAHPSGFSPYARDYFQTRYGGNWINQHEITFADLTNASLNLVSATNHDSSVSNQLKIKLPTNTTEFAPYTGEYQYYSSQGHDLNSTLSFDVSLPQGSSSLTMKAHWNIEVDWDYLVVKVNDTVIAGNHTTDDNPLDELPDVYNYISADSKSLPEAEGDAGWVDLTFDLSAYQNQQITITIEYITDTYVSEYGFVADDIRVVNNDNVIFQSGGESVDEVNLSGGFLRTQTWSLAGAEHHYYVQLRQHEQTDKYLLNAKHDHGVLVWYRNTGVADNRVNSHPGEVFVGVVDADQNPIKQGSSYRDTGSQITDAAFSLYDQSVKVSGDSHLAAVTIFDDRLDYSAPYQPESGIKLPKYGLILEVTSQATNSANATLNLAKVPLSYIVAEHNGLEVTFSLDGDLASDNTSYEWNMGDNTLLTGTTVTHTYLASGAYDVTVRYQSAQGEQTLTYAVVVGEIITGDFTSEVTGKEVQFTPALTGGEGEYSYRWDFGDNSDISNEITPSHTYESYGNYTVTLTVTDETLQSFEFIQTVSVENVLTANISYNANHLVVNFTAEVTGGDENYSYEWDFGDNATSSLENPQHSYANAGSYTVILTVTDGIGQTSQSSKTITVSAAVTTPAKPAKKSSGGGAFAVLLLMLIPVRYLCRRA
ncbi:M6 family metalloprotease domain-containing protein [Thalassotalea sp. G2M2-11]|uniref:M6 family metalloprotease domain-containing protein n=1 Tax=Thalassotalea sp. G2M2-11 TaxID=2787627 RepID=UPI0019CFFC89|nr:M6 family metalloprotease domain-containing protein [Thalassotalea sp. G2M2-11]